MRFAVLTYGNTENPRGFPGEYPAQTYTLRDGESVKSPWVEMDEAQLEALKQSLVVEVETIAQASRDSEKRRESDKLDALKRLFDEAEAIDDAWASATNQQKFDLARNTFKILRKIRGFILDQYRS